MQADLGHRLFAMNRTREPILQAPAAPAPPGIIPNFENPPNTASYMIPVFAAVVIFTNLVFLVKIWVQLRIFKRMLIEDWILSLAWLVYNGAFCVVAILICRLPVGVHQWDVTVEKYMRHVFVCPVVEFRRASHLYL